MKTLYLLRHAKSDWSEGGMTDFDRPLAPRGREAAPAMGRYMKSKKLAPDLVLCSAAARAKETWDLVAAELGGAPEVRVLKGLYMASPGRLLDALRKVPAGVRSVLLIGHNPGMEVLAERLVGSGTRKAIARLAVKYPTGALAAIQFKVDDWAALADGTGHLTRFMRPKDLD